MNVEELPIDKVSRDPDQPRKAFRQQDIEELAQSIAKHGIIQPISVRPDGEAYLVIAGERRLRAAQEAGLTTVPCIVRDFEEDDRKAIQILENVARADLNAMEEAEAYDALRDMGWKEESIAHSVGKSVAYVTARLSLLRLAPSLGGLVRAGQMNTTTAYLLAKLEGESQHQAAKAWLSNGLSTAALTKVVDKLLSPQESMFGDDEAPARSKAAKNVRERIEQAIARATDAVGSALDPKTLELLPEALDGDTRLVTERLAMLEKAVASLRAEVEASAAARPKGMWE